MRILLRCENNHLFCIIKTIRSIKFVQNEKFNFPIHRAGLLSWIPWTSWPELSVSRPSKIHGLGLFYRNILAARISQKISGPKNGKLNWSPAENCIRDYDLNTVCNDRCFEETYKCILSCDSDSDCVYQCIRAEAPCLESKLSNLNLFPWKCFLTTFQNKI